MPLDSKSASRRVDAPRDGGPQALSADDLMPLVYQELRRLAARYLSRERAGVTLQPTGLVHEAYLRLARQDRARFNDRAHFFRLAAQTMRRILVDRYRGRRAQKRGADPVRITLSDAGVCDPGASVDLLALHDALERLALLDEQQAMIVQLRFFAGLTVEETAEALGISTPTVKRDWAMARAWLVVTLGPQAGPSGR